MIIAMVIIGRIMVRVIRMTVISRFLGPLTLNTEIVVDKTLHIFQKKLVT